MDLQLTEETVEVRQTLDLGIWEEGWLEIPWHGIGTLVDVQWGDLEGFVEASGNQVKLRVRGVGRHQLEIRSVDRLSELGEGSRVGHFLSFKRPQSALVTAELRLEDPSREPMFENGERVEPSQGLLEAQDQGQGIYRWWIGGGSWLKLRLMEARRTPESESMPLRLQHELWTVIEASRTRVSVSTTVYSILSQGRVPSTEWKVPEGFEVLSVEGRHSGWDVQAGMLTVHPPDDPSKAEFFVVRMLGSATDRLTAPLLSPRTGEMNRHVLLANAKGDGLLELENAESLRFAGEADLRGAPSLKLSSGRALVLKDPENLPVWTVEWADSAQVLATQIDRLLVDVMVGDSGRAAYQLWVELRNQGGRLLTLEPPAGFRWAKASRDGSPMVPGMGGQDGALAVSLESTERKRQLYFSGFVDLRLPSEGGVFNLPVPKFSAPVAKVEARVILPPGNSYRLAEPTRAGSVTKPSSSTKKGGSYQDVLKSNAIAGQLVLYGGGASVSQELWPQPDGFQLIEASWSALSASPQPLRIEVETRKETASWF